MPTFIVSPTSKGGGPPAYLRFDERRRIVYTSDMTADELREFLEREPFEPVRVRLSSGDAYEIRNPGLAVVMRSRLFIAAPGTDRWTLIPFLHIAAVETIANGHARRPPRRR